MDISALLTNMFNNIKKQSTPDSTNDASSEKNQEFVLPELNKNVTSNQQHVTNKNQEDDKNKKDDEHIPMLQKFAKITEEDFSKKRFAALNEIMNLNIIYDKLSELKDNIPERKQFYTSLHEYQLAQLNNDKNTKMLYQKMLENKTNYSIKKLSLYYDSFNNLLEKNNISLENIKFCINFLTHNFSCPTKKDIKYLLLRWKNELLSGFITRKTYNCLYYYIKNNLNSLI